MNTQLAILRDALMPEIRDRAAQALFIRRHELGLSQEDVANTAGSISQRTVSELERGKYSPDKLTAARAAALARALKWTLVDLQVATGVDFGLSPSEQLKDFFGTHFPGFNNSAADSASTPPYIPSTVREIPEVVLMPVYSLASAGIPMQDAEPLDYDPIAMPRDQWHPALMLFLAEGDSMSDGQEDSIRSGDILHVDMRDTDPTEGRVMVVQIPGQGVTVKRVRMLGGAYWLFSDNPDQRKYPPFQADEAKILGGVHELTRKVKVRLS
jgi:repressor LexA